MIQKNTLQSVISKYYLDGLVEQVKWEVKSKKLTINFMVPDRDMLGKVELDKFDLEDVNLAIYNTTQLNKLLGITAGELLLKVNKNKLNISDTQFDVSYSLAELFLIGKVASAEEPKQYTTSFTLDVEQQNALIKSKNALGIEDKTLLISGGLSLDKEPVLLFTFGENTEHSNKVTYTVPIKKEVNINLVFNSEYVKSILSANKELEKCNVSILADGLLKFNFTDKSGINSEYFLIAK